MINKKIGEQTMLSGNDYKQSLARVVPSTYELAEDGDKQIYIRQGASGVSLSLESLKDIIYWAEKE
jgi:hypothetical protein